MAGRDEPSTASQVVPGSRDDQAPSRHPSRLVEPESSRLIRTRAPSTNNGVSIETGMDMLLMRAAAQAARGGPAHLSRDNAADARWVRVHERGAKGTWSRPGGREDACPPSQHASVCPASAVTMYGYRESGA